MAERRMFAKTIIDSDAFLDMPLSAQALYFHLSMRADDEGFINNPKKIQRMIGALDDDLKLLIAKRFIIPFDSGVVVIKHWRIHNYIRADRLIETNYQDEKAQLSVKENGAYTLIDEIAEIKKLDAKDARKAAYENSTLPYSFTYKIKRAFEGHTCPVCGHTMNASVRKPTIQHNTPISKGGEHEIYNISVICDSCNASIQDKETDELNNHEVIEMWDRIVAAERHGIKWFYTPEILESVDVSQMSDTCQPDDGIGEVRLGKDSIGKNSLEEDKDKKRKRFSPPTLDEVKAYCAERKNNVDAERFVNYYESNGWMVGKSKMKDWKAAVRTWEKNSFDNKKKNVEIPVPDYMQAQIDEMMSKY